MKQIHLMDIVPKSSDANLNSLQAFKFEHLSKFV